MPKDATKNVDRYKIRGGQLNEFDFHQNQEEFAEQQATKASKAPTSAKKMNATKVAKGSKEGNRPRGATAKKLAARKAATKKR